MLIAGVGCSKRLHAYPTDVRTALTCHVVASLRLFYSSVALGAVLDSKFLLHPLIRLIAPRR